MLAVCLWVNVLLLFHLVLEEDCDFCCTPWRLFHCYFVCQTEIHFPHLLKTYVTQDPVTFLVEPAHVAHVGLWVNVFLLFHLVLEEDCDFCCTPWRLFHCYFVYQTEIHFPHLLEDICNTRSFTFLVEPAHVAQSEECPLRRTGGHGLDTG